MSADLRAEFRDRDRWPARAPIPDLSTILRRHECHLRAEFRDRDRWPARAPSLALGLPLWRSRHPHQPHDHARRVVSTSGFGSGRGAPAGLRRCRHARQLSRQANSRNPPALASTADRALRTGWAAAALPCAQEPVGAPLIKPSPAGLASRPRPRPLAACDGRSGDCHAPRPRVRATGHERRTWRSRGGPPETKRRSTKWCATLHRPGLSPATFEVGGERPDSASKRRRQR